MEARLQEIKKQRQEKKQSNHEVEVEENDNIRNNITELEETLINNLTINCLEPKLDKSKKK
jgi:hypothetical protein